ncbi:MAG: vanadium-dependent haloperoxidase [Pseudomonadota bacterium]
MSKVHSAPRLRALIAKATLLLALFGAGSPVHAMPFDFDTGNAATEVVIPAIVPILAQQVSPTFGDATLVLRVTTLVTNGWFDATAPYHPTAVGVYSRLGRRPPAEAATNANINVALIYASYHILQSLLPRASANWRAMVAGAGLDPDDATTDATSAVGLGNLAGAAVVAGRVSDGMNQLGDVGRAVVPAPYRDYTGYRSVNTPDFLRDPSRWQPDVQRVGIGLFKAQRFVTPQYAFVEPYSYADPNDYSVPPPFRSNWQRFPGAYRAQAEGVLAASAALTEEQKLKAEFFDDKIASLGISALFAAVSQGLTTLEFVQLDFLLNMAAFDAGIFVWNEKAEYDAVRPYSAIRFLLNRRPVSAWGGPGRGTIELPANEWRSYLEEADHPEYPSASTCFCNAHAQAARLQLGSDSLFYPVNYPAGSSRVEPGLTPATDTTLVFDTWTDFANDCGQSRVWAGVHFQAAVDEAAAVCGQFGDVAFDYFSTLVDGSSPIREPSAGRATRIR